MLVWLVAGVLFCLVLGVVCCSGGGSGVSGFPLEKPALWDGGICRQTTVDTSRLKDNTIRARVDGVWQDFRLVSLPDDFIKWAIARRAVNPAEKPDAFLAAHCGLVATYGCPRNDSRFHINNAAKGLGFLPKPEKIAEVNRMIEDAFKKPLKQRLALLKELYQDFHAYFDTHRLVSLELYSRPDFETQTFINQMTNPACSVVFLDMTSYELKAIAQLLHPDDTRLSRYEKEVVRFANLMHDFGHGAKQRAKKQFITVIYHIVEVYDNSPRLRGVRVKP